MVRFLFGFKMIVLISIGWLHCVLVTGVFCVGLDGTLVCGRHNCPGSWNDGEMSRALQLKLCDPTLIGEGMKLASDSAFPNRGDLEGKIVTPLKEGDIDRVPPQCRLAMQIMSDSITSLRQAAEWGDGSRLQSISAIDAPVPYNPECRALRLNNIFRLYNFRVRRTGISQIKTVFKA